MAILTIDQGTTGTTVLLIDGAGEIVEKAYQEFEQIYPHPGWVEHDPQEIWRTVEACVDEVMTKTMEPVHAIGITNQRETTVLWDTTTGKPVYNAIVWQCRRTSNICEDLESHRNLIKAKTGLPLDAYFSGTKAQWILENAIFPDHADLRFGTIDTWLIWKLTNGRVHATDHSNASRTMLYNIHEKAWDEDLCDLLRVPMEILPEVKRSADDYGSVSSISSLSGVPIYGVIGDQQASLYGQQCFSPGEIKNTYGTGCFIVMNTGKEAVDSQKGLITTLAAAPDGSPCYALEGSIFVAGAAMQWLRDEMGLLKDAADSEAAARSVKDNGGVFFVPAFVGLGAPHWAMEARGMITGLTRGSNRNHLIRAGLESMAYQTHDVVQTMLDETGLSIDSLAVDGGATANDFLMQFQADILDMNIDRAKRIETTALGAAYLAGLKKGIWTSDDLRQFAGDKTRFESSMSATTRKQLLSGWQSAIRKVLDS